MSLLTEINLIKYQQAAKEKLTLLIDPATRSIPNDPVFVCYADGGIATPRLFSKAAVIEYLHQNSVSRNILKELQEDKTGFFVALKHADQLSDAEEKYKNFLLTLKNLSAEKIIQILKNLIYVSKIFYFSEEIRSVLFRVYCILDYESKTHIEQFLNVLQKEEDFEQAVRDLCQFYEYLFYLQTEINLIHHNKLVRDNRSLGETEFICPVTRRITSGHRTLASQQSANKFLAIFIVLSHLAKVESEDIQTFLEQQPIDYFNKAEQLLYHYARFPAQYNFSKEQVAFLNAVGAREVISHIRYKHLWQDGNSFEENVLSLLIDYNKQNWQYPSLGLFLTGHWNRHHQERIREAIQELQDGKNVHLVIKELKDYIDSINEVNPDGSLAMRLAYMHHKMDEATVSLAAASSITPLNP
ncbi:DUF5617 domain-containing protein [Legionella jordanis]|uniref:RavJ-like C-terminal domain-containing protein n=1 Tax=Legionella jordanis TaxID=456 RepID=A0A0W0V9L1_9GAMM|nr:DUF5617 domain-containing protein [Legionella jordanis]KTD16767.1 hypothetical protein Ljor_1073 [Legionella jordanis]RMX03705.1 hypothetical protein EAW55_04880 [Legionella jordanis]RMX22233.1 hypothetical protein EAS68_01545 [Legionella jordanis]VEH11765.1 Uncharacterised protein [Legionella jordanis]HAT8712925.1 hypothetical protein [Legionella jordanis]